jgi:Uma2 family endonuclease
MIESAFEPGRRKFTADEFHRMVEAGIIHEDEKVELIEGELIAVSPQSSTHSFLTVIIRKLLERALGEGFFIQDHSPVKGTADSLPEPDLAAVRGSPRRFGRLPGPEDTVLVVELSVSSRAIDRRKAGVYAGAGYATYWLVDVDARKLEVRTGPRPDGDYATTRILDESAEVELPEGGGTLAVRELLP